MARAGPLIIVASLIAIVTGISLSGTFVGDRTVPSPETSHPEAAVEELRDPVSIPEEPTVSLANFRSHTEARLCHPNHYAQWKTSMHAYSMIDPVYRALVGKLQEDLGGSEDRACTQCHSAIGTRSGDIVPGFSFAQLDPITLEGVTCEACHKVVGIKRVYNSGHYLDDQAAMHGPIRDPIENRFHASVYSPLHDSSEFCGGCHDVVVAEGLRLERPYLEWVTSPAAREGRNCQSCHMPTYTGRASTVEGVPERDNLHVHRFIGVDMPLTDDFITDPELYEEIRAEVRALLRSAGSLELAVSTSVPAAEEFELLVTVRNLIDAHNLPTGSTFYRQLWLEIIATDANDRTIYQTGTLDDNGDLRDEFSGLDPDGDDDLITLTSILIDAKGGRTFFGWEAIEMSPNAIPPLGSRTYSLSVPTSQDTAWPITIAGRLRFRAFPPFLMVRLGLEDIVPKLEVVDIAEARLVLGSEHENVPDVAH